MDDLNLIPFLHSSPNSRKPVKNSSSNALEIQLQSNGTYIQWKYVGFEKWNNLIAIKELKGDRGSNGANGADGNEGQRGLPGINGANGRDGLDGKDGQDGVQGKPGERGLPGKAGEPGIDGLDGKDGKNGKDGREVELRKSDTHVQWRYKGELLWKNLILLSDIRGPKGDPGKDGQDGKPGKNGRDGYDGTPGRQGPPGYNGKDGKDGLTTSVNNVEHVGGNISLDTDDIPDTATNGYISDTEKAQLGKIIHFGTVATAAATAAKEVTIADYTPAVGDIICVTYTLGSTVGSPTLSINGGDAINIQLNGTNANTTVHNILAGAEVKYCYDGTYWQMFGSQRISDSNNMELDYMGVACKVGVETTRYKILMQGTDDKFYPITIGDVTTTGKTIATTEFKIGGLVVWYATTATLAADDTSVSMYTELNSSNFRYAINKAASTLTANTNLYLKGTINANGNFVLDNTSTTSAFVEALPTTDDGFVYMFLGYSYTTNAFKLMQQHPIYQFKDGALRLYSPDYLPIVDKYSDLADLDASITKAIVKQDTLAPRTWTTMAKNTLYSRLYVNPLPYLWGEDYEDYIGLSLDAGGTQIYAAVEPSETEGFILCTLQLKGILLSEAIVMAVQHNYMNAPFEISFDGKIYIEVEGGWINTLAYVDNATNEVTDVTMTPTNAGNIKSFADTYLLTANDNADEWLRLKYLIQPTPFTVNYSGVYEKIDSVWTLVMRNDKLVNGNTTAPE